ncbi:MAG: ATP-binding protein [Flavobacteriales bacterium]
MFTRYILPSLFALSVVFPGSLSAQSDEGDSLRTLLAHTTIDSARVRLLERISADWLYNQGNMDSTRWVVERAVHLYDRLPEEQRKAMQRLRMKLHEKLGFALHQTGVNDKALEEWQAGARIAEELGSSVDLAGFYMYMAQAFRVMLDNANVRAYCGRALRILEPLGPSTDLALTEYNLAAYYNEKDQWDSAEYFAKRALDFFREDDDPMRQLAAELMLLGTYHGMRALDSAEKHLAAAEAIADRVSYPESRMMLYGMRGRIELSRGQFAQALASIDSSMEISERLGIPMDRMEVYRLRGLALAANHRMDEAFTALDSSRAAMFRDMGLEKQREMTEVRMSFEQEKERAVADAELRKQQVQKWAAMAIGALALVLALVWYRSFRAKSKANEEIRRTQVQLIESEKHREAEQVRTRIARDIHDDIGASLTKIKLLSDVAMKNSPDQAEETKRALTRIGEHARTVSQAMSDIVWAVDPKRDTHQGMIDHARLLAQRLLGDNGIAFTLDLSAAAPTRLIEPWLKRDLHLVINEAFNNILKYALAKTVTVKLHLGERFELSIADDGIGFHPAQVGTQGNGLRNMPERMKRHRGSLTISSSPGKGCTVDAEGPVA